MPKKTRFGKSYPGSCIAVDLAKRLKKSHAFVSGAESGTSRVGERYVKAVMAACGLAED